MAAADLPQKKENIWRIMDMKKKFENFLREEDGMGTVEVILIIVVLIGLVLIFKTQLTQIVNNIFSKISSQSSRI